MNLKLCVGVILALSLIITVQASPFGYNKIESGTDSSSTNSVVTIITNGTDTNETTRFNILVGTDCGAGDFVIGVQANGALLCATPTSVGDNSSWNHSAYWLNASTTFVLISAYNTNYSANDASYRNMTNRSYVTWAEVTNGTVSGGGVTWSDVINGTVLTTALYNTNYSTNHLAYLNTTNITYDGYNSTGLIKDWNVTGYIKNWSFNISNANTSLYNWIIAQSYTANGVSLSTLLGFSYYNSTNPPPWNATNTSYYLVSNPYGYYNSTNFNINNYLNSTYTLGNITSANTSLLNWIVAQGYTSGGLTWANIVNGTMALNSSLINYVKYNNLSESHVNRSDNWDEFQTVNSTQMNSTAGTLTIKESWLEATITKYFGWLLSTKTTDDLTEGTNNKYDNRSWNQSKYYSNATATFALIGASEVDPYWTGNKSAYANYSNVTGLFLKISDYNSTNASYYLITNPYGFLNSTSNIGNWTNDKGNYSTYANQTVTFSTISEPLWTDNFTKYNTTWSSITNLSYVTWAEVTNGTVSGGGITWANAVNGTLVNWTYALNGTLFRLTDFNTNYTANDQIYRSFSLNYSDYLAIRNYALNDSKWTGNFTLYNVTWSLWANDKTNYSTYPNQTTTFSLKSEPLWTGNFTAYNTSWSSITNTSYRILTNNTFTGYANITGNTNISAGNLTLGQLYRVCLNAGCTRYMLDNGTGVVIHGG